MNIKNENLTIFVCDEVFCNILCPFLCFFYQNFFFYSEMYTYNLMSWKLLALFLSKKYMYIFVFKVHSSSSGKICIHSYHDFFRDGITWSQTKVHNSILIRNLFPHLIDGSCSLHVIGIPCINLPCKWKLDCSQLVRSVSVASF